MKDRDFCIRLRRMRTAKSLTQVELEKRADLPAASIAQYETGERTPGLKNLKAICKGLGCTATELLGV